MSRNGRSVDEPTEIAEAARGGMVGFAGAAVSALMGFALTIVLARALGDDGTGVVLQAIAAFTIAQSIAKLGMDTAAVWLLPRLAQDSPADVRAAATAMLWPAAIAGLLAALLLAVLAPMLSTGSEVSDAIVAAGWFLPCGTVLMVALSGTRGTGGIVPYTLIGSIALPSVRPAAVAISAVASGTALAGAVAWAAPLPIALICAVAVLCVRVLRIERRHGVTGGLIADAALRRRIWGFATPRTVSSALEQSIVWLDVMLVGAIAGAGAAGVYGTASRFVTAGLIVATAIRIVVAPRFSALLARGDVERVRELYRVTTTWIVLFGTPVYLGFAMFSPTVLDWFGPEFDRGAASLAVLCAGSVVVLLAGNIQALLLMSGHSGWGAVNKGIVLAVNVTGNLLLVPAIGIVGAAVTWAVSMVLDAGLAAYQVRRFTGVSPMPGAMLYPLLVATVCATVPSAVAIAALGQRTVSVVAAALVALVLLGSWCAAERARFRLGALAGLTPARRSREGV